MSFAVAEPRNPNLGWYIGLALTGIILLIGAGVWIHVHGV
jgi:hypothetical protein